jgi:hypothetical protein
MTIATKTISLNGKTIKISLIRGVDDRENRLDGMLVSISREIAEYTEIVIYDASGKAIASGSKLSGLSRGYNQYDEAVKRGCKGMVGKCYLMPETYDAIAVALAELDAENPKTDEQIEIEARKAAAKAAGEAWLDSKEYKDMIAFERRMDDPNSDL